MNSAMCKELAPIPKEHYLQCRSGGKAVGWLHLSQMIRSDCRIVEPGKVTLPSSYPETIFAT